MKQFFKKISRRAKNYKIKQFNEKVLKGTLANTVS